MIAVSGRPLSVGVAQARDRLSEAVAHRDGRLGRIATMLDDAEAEILAFYAFPPGHRRSLTPRPGT
jgi:hypothetical protein